MLRKIHGTNFFHIKFLDLTSNIKIDQCCPPAQIFYFKGQALKIKIDEKEADYVYSRKEAT
jgi:hypothetical protein